MASINRGDPTIRQAVSRYAELALCGLLVLSAFNIPALPVHTAVAAAVR